MSSMSDYSDVSIFVRQNIKIKEVTKVQVAFKSKTPVNLCLTDISNKK